MLLGLLRPKVTEWVPIAFPLFSSAVFVGGVSNKKDQVGVSIRQSDWPSVQNCICVVVLYSFPIYCCPSERFLVPNDVGFSRHLPRCESSYPSFSVRLIQDFPQFVQPFFPGFANSPDILLVVIDVVSLCGSSSKHFKSFLNSSQLCRFVAAADFRPSLFDEHHPYLIFASR